MGWYGGSGGSLPSAAAYTVEGNPTASTATPTAFTIGSLTAKTVPASTDQLMLQDNAASGALKSVPWSSMPGAGGGMSIGGAVTGGTAGSVLFVGSGPVLAQDNANFSWDDTNDILLIGKQLNILVNAVSTPALYPVYNSTNNNWFVGQAGNLTLTGWGNMALGATALSALTSGANNTAVGAGALYALTSGQNNFGLGTNAALFVNGNDNVCIGTASLGAYSVTGDGNVVIGTSGLGAATGSLSNNTVIGRQAGNSITGGSNNTLIGRWSGPSGAMSNVIAISDGAGNLSLDYNYTTASVWTFPAEVDLATGTASVAPMKFKSGANLTTAAVGACEFDGTAFYQTAVASARQVVDTEQVQVLSANRTFTNNTSAQAIFNATTNGTITVAASTTYEFEMFVNVTGFSASAHTVNLGFAGTATYTSIGYFFDAQTGSTAATPTATLSGFIATNAASAVCASSTTTGLILRARGFMRINAAGTVIPQLTQVTASAAAVVQANSFFRCWPIGSNTVTNVGNWS